MAYTIALRDVDTARRVVAELKNRLNRSRFTVSYYKKHDGIEVVTTPKGVEIQLRNIRLRVSKDYCGNHPGPCRGVGQRHRRSPCLEGLDWCSFSDLVNDLLDDLNVEADVKTNIWIRKGGRRRVNYGMSFLGGHVDWEKKGDDSDYEDWRGRQAPPTKFPDGTPGVYDRQLETVT